ncbi:LuxR C-terminal-related transcriptional regulator [Thiohalocapsa marina]|uniref:LuxR C-terminal-related transcriptional regulator n=1 Tax=Thiohalocapsa marina TaxID=424902 RepID=UPI001B861750|nr:response regulator transcription factor [Thiohalocapsa marina]
MADDHALLRLGLIDALTQMDPQLQAHEAADATQVLEQLAAVPDADLILLDLFMPGANGFELLSQVCERSPAPVVVLSASELVADMRSALDCGAAGYIPKSTPRELLLSALQLVLAGGTYAPPALVQAGKQPGASGNATTPTADPAALTSRQQQILRMIGRGYSNKQIATELHLAENTVKVHVTNILRQLGVGNRTEAVTLARERGFGLDPY